MAADMNESSGQQLERSPVQLPDPRGAAQERRDTLMMGFTTWFIGVERSRRCARLYKPTWELLEEMPEHDGVESLPK